MHDTTTAANTPTITGTPTVTVAGTVRFSALSPTLVRMQYAPDGRFRDHRSVRALCNPAPQPFRAIGTQDGWVRLDTGAVQVWYSPDGRALSPSNLRVERPDGSVHWDPGCVDTANLGGVHKSLDTVRRGFIPHGVHPATVMHHRNDDSCGLEMAINDQGAADLTDTHCPPERRHFPPGILSRSGYFLYNDTPVDTLDDEGTYQVHDVPDERQEWYLFCYGQDFRTALMDYRLLFGPAPLLPRFVLGIWYSRFPSLPEGQLRELVDTFAAKDLPLDVVVVDLEWHLHGWRGYDWNTAFYPDPDALIGWLHDREIRCGLNTHPDKIPIDDSRFAAFMEQAGISAENLPGVEEARTPTDERLFDAFSITNPAHAAAFMEVLHLPVHKQGIDFWWCDGGAPQSPGVYNQLWTNHVYTRHTQARFPHTRPLILSRSSGLGSHRYPVHFTGDAFSQWEVLAHEVEYTVRAGHMGLSMVSHDIGGFFGDKDMLEEHLYARWIQWGAISPVVRLHSANGGERRPWLYGPTVQDALRRSMRLRMELLPYLYHALYEHTVSCIPLCRSCPLMMPQWEEGYGVVDAFFLGESLYCAPVVTPGTRRDVLLPPGDWYRAGTGGAIRSDGKLVIPEKVPAEDRPLYYVRAGSTIVRQPFTSRASRCPETLYLDIYPARSPQTWTTRLYLDDGHSGEHRHGNYSLLNIVVSQEPSGIDVQVTGLGDNDSPWLPQSIRVRLQGSVPYPVSSTGIERHSC